MPAAADLSFVDCEFWGIRLRDPYKSVGYVPWDMPHCHMMVGVLASTLGPDVLASLVSALPVLFSRGQVVEGLTAILVERSGRLETAMRRLMESGLLVEGLHDVYAVQGAGDLRLTEPMSEVLKKGNTLGRRAFSSVFDVYTAAVACTLENLLPLGPGGIESRRSILPATPAAEGVTERMEMTTLRMPTIRHIRAWLGERHS
jgi:hypothetical protein